MKNINLVKSGTSFLKEFQKFAVKGNVMDMAIGVITDDGTMIKPENTLQAKCSAEFFFDFLPVVIVRERNELGAHCTRVAGVV